MDCMGFPPEPRGRSDGDLEPTSEDDRAAAVSVVGAAPPVRARRPMRRALLHAALALAGIAVLWALIRHVGAQALLGMMRRAASLMPLLLVLEVGRLGCDMLATLSLCPPGRVPLAELIRIHVVAYPIATIMPAGRTSAETVKAALLSPFLGAPRAAAISATNQSLSFIAAGLLSFIAALATWHETGVSAMTLGVLLHFTLATSSGVALCYAARQRALGAWVMRRLTRVGPAAMAFQDAVHERPPIPPRALAALCANRALQAVQYAVLLAAVGAATGPFRALVAHGVNAVGSALGELIPAQVGATDGAFTLAAPTLGVSASAAVAISVLAHLVQACGALAGLVAALVWRRAPLPSAALSPEQKALDQASNGQGSARVP